MRLVKVRQSLVGIVFWIIFILVFYQYWRILKNKNDRNYLTSTSSDSILILGNCYNARNFSIFQKFVASEEVPSSYETPGQLCPLIPRNLRGPIRVYLDMSQITRHYLLAIIRLKPDGHYSPMPQCIPRHKVAIIVPFRDRHENLEVFLLNIHSFLQKQNIEYGIYVIEQVSPVIFNKGMLMNIGVIESLVAYNYSCFIFHDVDLIPMDDRILYSCSSQPRHLSVSVDKLGFKLPYYDLIGGVAAITREHFLLMNGYSNKFWGWGGEDDDMAHRIHKHSLFISRYPSNIARYATLPHLSSWINPDRFKILYSKSQRMDLDGYNSVNYTKVDTSYPGNQYTLIKVALHKY